MMKKRTFLKLGCLLLALVFVFAIGCAKKTPATPPPANEPPSNEPVKGGTLTILTSSGPRVLSWAPEFGPTDFAGSFPGGECLLAVSSERVLEPVLAESFQEDPDNLKITFNLRKGIKYHDGSDFNAHTVKWQFDINQANSNRATKIASVDAVDDYTVVLNLTEWDNQIIEGIAITLMTSKEAFEKAAAGDLEKGKEWARSNFVGTGPFMLKEWQRDVSMHWVKNENYWREGEPYLDEVIYKYIPEATTAKALLENGDAQVWLGATAQDVKDMEAKGFVRQYGWAGLQYHLMPSVTDPNSPFKDQRVREALEYALDKQAISDTIGMGYSEPIYNVAPPTDWGGDYAMKRMYDPAKSKALLAEAGYPNGLSFKLFAMAGSGGRNEMAEAVANYLKEAGFNVELDIADAGRFYGAMFGAGWNDVALMFSGQDTTYLTSIYRWWGHNTGVSIQSIYKPEEFLELSRQSILKRTREEQKAITAEIVKMMADQAIVIPITNTPGSFLHNGKLHTSYYEQGFTRWIFGDMWLEQ